MKKVIKAAVCLLFLFFITTTTVSANELAMGNATVYSLGGKTAMGTPVRYGICATGNKAWLGKTCIVYQRLPDNTIGDVIGIYTIEDTGCKSNVIDIWCPRDLQKVIINKTYEKGCKGRIWIQIINLE